MFQYEKPRILTWAGDDLRELLGPAETSYFHVATSNPLAQGTMQCSGDITLVTTAGTDPRVTAIDPATVRNHDVLLKQLTEASCGNVMNQTIPVDVSVIFPGTLVVHPEIPLHAGDYRITVPAPGQEIKDLTPSPNTRSLDEDIFSFKVAALSGLAISLNNGACIQNVTPGKVIRVPIRVKACPAVKLCTAQLNVRWTNRDFTCAGVAPAPGWETTGGNGCNKKCPGEALVKLVKRDCSTGAAAQFYVADLTLTVPEDAAATTPLNIQVDYPYGPAFFDSDGLSIATTAENSCYPCGMCSPTGP